MGCALLLCLTAGHAADLKYVQAFATGDLQEAWASLPPELKGLMMQTVIGAGMGGPGGGAPGGMNGMPGLPPMPGMDPMMMNGFGLGMPGGMPGLPPHMMSGPPPMALQNHMGGQTPLNGPPGMPIMQMDRGEPVRPSLSMLLTLSCRSNSRAGASGPLRRWWWG